MDLQLGEPWALSPSVALRPEPFGALAYHFGTRGLTFLKRPELVTVVRQLGEQPDVASALIAAGVPAPQHPAYVQALRGLAAKDVIRPRDAATHAATHAAAHAATHAATHGGTPA